MVNRVKLITDRLERERLLPRWSGTFRLELMLSDGSLEVLENVVGFDIFSEGRGLNVTFDDNQSIILSNGAIIKNIYKVVYTEDYMALLGHYSFNALEA